MSAVVALTGHGGWPMSVFLTPDLHPFYGGTYFPPRPAHGLPGFRELLGALATAWQMKRDEIVQESARLTEQILAQSSDLPEQAAFDARFLAPGRDYGRAAADGARRGGGG